MPKYLTLTQAGTVANGVLAKVRAKNYAVAATTLAGYGITDAYTKSEVDNAIAEVAATAAKPGGSLNADEVLATLLVAGNEGKVYNLAEDFTTTSDFVDGAGIPLPAGSNIWVINTAAAGETAEYKFDTYAAGYGVATPSGNGLMSATDKTKLDNADVTAYTGTGAISVSNHEISIAAAAASTAGVGGNAGSMSAADKEKLDNADVTAYTPGNGIDITNHAVSVDIDSTGGNGLGITAGGKLKLDTVTASTSGVGGSAGAMTAAQAEKLADIETASDADITALVNGLDSL